MVKDKQIELIRITSGLRIDEIAKKYPNHIMVVKTIWGDRHIAIYTMRDKTKEEIEADQLKDFQRLKNTILSQAWENIRKKITQGKSHPNETRIIFLFENAKTHEDKVRLLDEYS